MPEIKFKHFDEYREQGILRGVFLGGCVERGDGSSFRRKAHAHTDVPGQTMPGWICVRSRRRLMSTDGRKPSLLMWHELAHLISRQGHTKKWRETMRSLCGRTDYSEKEMRRRHPKQHRAKSIIQMMVKRSEDAENYALS